MSDVTPPPSGRGLRLTAAAAAVAVWVHEVEGDLRAWCGVRGGGGVRRELLRTAAARQQHGGRWVCLL